MDQIRTVISVTGADAKDFLQGLITNDLDQAEGGLVYAALLSPQGKYLIDFFLLENGDGYLLDAPADLAPGLIQRLSLYRLRAEVLIEKTEITPALGMGEVPDGAYPDPRHPKMGWRAYDGREGDTTVDWAHMRVKLGIPQAGIELIPNDSYILEMGFERLNGVDFKKGCFVGQEIVARMKHKTELRKGLARVAVDGDAETGSEIKTEDGKPAGTLYSQSSGEALAYLRFDRAQNPLYVGETPVRFLERLDKPS